MAGETNHAQGEREEWLVVVMVNLSAEMEVLANLKNIVVTGQKSKKRLKNLNDPLTDLFVSKRSVIRG
jgi:hypothetical protein